jgi:26S proteasome regulatory subunit N7
MASEGEETQQPQLILADKLFLLKQSDVQDIDKVRFREDVFNFVKEHGICSFSLSISSISSLFVNPNFLICFLFSSDMVPLYETLVADSVLDLDRALLDSMRAKIDDELKKLDEK